jgi:hypothetical protein
VPSSPPWSRGPSPADFVNDSRGLDTAQGTNNPGLTITYGDHDYTFTTFTHVACTTIPSGHEVLQASFTPKGAIQGDKLLTPILTFEARPDLVADHRPEFKLPESAQSRRDPVAALTSHLRTKRAMRRPAGARQQDGRGLRPGILNISERPAEAEVRAVPGHWEGDLVFGKRMSPVATLVERSIRFVMLVALPDGHKADLVADALAAKITTLPAALTRTLTWDQGHEMAQHVRFTEATGVEVFFCDPKSPWQRGSNENTNGLLRQYLPRTLDFRTLTQADFDAMPTASTADLDRPSASRHHHNHWPRCRVDRLSPQA